VTPASRGDRLTYVASALYHAPHFPAIALFPIARNASPDAPWDVEVGRITPFPSAKHNLPRHARFYGRTVMNKRHANGRTRRTDLWPNRRSCELGRAIPGRDKRTTGGTPSFCTSSALRATKSVDISSLTDHSLSGPQRALRETGISANSELWFRDGPPPSSHPSPTSNASRTCLRWVDANESDYAK
jgi:hypothetical protein